VERRKDWGFVASFRARRVDVAMKMTVLKATQLIWESVVKYFFDNIKNTYRHALQILLPESGHR
jgi:hypothetical protein